MNAFWIEFAGHASGCVEADSEEEARQIGTKVTDSEVVECSRLPYPANPRLNKQTYSSGVTCPSFCYQPEKCKGRTCCTERYSCVE